MRRMGGAVLQRGRGHPISVAAGLTHCAGLGRARVNEGRGEAKWHRRTDAQLAGRLARQCKFAELGEDMVPEGRQGARGLIALANRYHAQCAIMCRMPCNAPRQARDATSRRSDTNALPCQSASRPELDERTATRLRS